MQEAHETRHDAEARKVEAADIEQLGSVFGIATRDQSVAANPRDA